MLPLPLAGRVALITGAGRGLGRTMARWLADAGADVALCARTAEGIDELGQEIRRAGRRVHTQRCDVANPVEVGDFVRASVEVLGGVDIAIANAAILGPVGAISRIDPDEFARTLSVNVAGTATLVHHLLPHMSIRPYGRILTMSGGGVGGPNLPGRVSAYVASKAAVVVLTEAFALELPAAVTINAIAPGAVPTGFMDEVLQSGPDVAGHELFTTVKNTTMPDLNALRELLFFVSGPDSAWLTGRCLSARWDTPAKLTAAYAQGVSKARYRLRRIDEDLYAEQGLAGS
jgi:3-oxoacyl-[acyl-carrier protein] reductase